MAKIVSAIARELSYFASLVLTNDETYTRKEDELEGRCCVESSQYNKASRRLLAVVRDLLPCRRARLRHKRPACTKHNTNNAHVERSRRLQ